MERQTLKSVIILKLIKMGGSKNVFAAVKSYSKRGKLLKNADFQTLAESRDLDELMTRIKNTTYGESISRCSKTIYIS